ITIVAGDPQHDLDEEHLVGTGIARLGDKKGYDFGEVLATNAIVLDVLIYWIVEHAAHLLDAFSNKPSSFTIYRPRSLSSSAAWLGVDYPRPRRRPGRSRAPTERSRQPSRCC